ncbi:MAG: DUF4349 domain-containing protein [Clostridia bacterium]|nr:DUF4349 domain-containing protein [Clostridia bacterium]
MNMNCTNFRANLDAYIDSELDRKTRRAMEEHAASCPDCGALLNQAMDVVTRCAELNEGLTVPLECQAAWRRAVRAEAEAKNEAREKKRSGRRSSRNAWVRALSATAAVLVLLFAVGSQLGLDGLPLPQAVSRNSAREFNGYDYADYASSTDFADYEEYSAPTSQYSGVSSAAMGMLPAGGVLLESDGLLDQTVSTAAQKSAADVIVLRSAMRSIVTKEFDADALFLDDLVSEYSAYFESRRVTGNAEDASRVLKATIRVPSESLDDFLTALDVRGTVTVREESAEDITSNYNDVTARLEVLRSQLQQLNEMNAQAKSVSDLIEINERANEVTAEIEAYESRIRDWNSRRSYSDVTLTLTELGEDEPEPTPKALTERMREAFEDSIQWLKDFGQNAAVFGAALLPRLVVWLPVLIIVIVLLRVAFGRRRKNKTK